MASTNSGSQSEQDRSTPSDNRTKNILVFLFFLAMASGFWLIQKLEEPMSVKLTVPLQLTNVPKDIIISTELPKEIQITVRDKGNELLPLFWTPRLDTLKINFEDYDTHEITDNTIFPPSAIQQMLKESLSVRSTITQMMPDTLVFSYNRGVHRKLPVRLRGSISTSSQYNLDGYTFTPESVEVYAPARVLDTMRAAYTEVHMLEELKQSTSLAVPLMHTRQMRFFPDTVSLDINVDILTRKSIEIYVQGIDFPEGKELRTLPATVTLTYLVSAAQARFVNPNLFQVTVSYDDIKNSTSNKCKPQIISMPGSVSSAFISPQQVDFLIEDITKVTPLHPTDLEDNR